MINLKIDPEFQSQIPPLTDDEFKQLEENILKEGKLISPLIVWGNTLVDGHNRYEIVQEHPEISFSTMPLPFESREEVLAWICKNQLGRRNLTPEQKKFLIGKQYSVEHRKPGGNGNNQHTAAAKKTAPEELCQIDTIPPTAAEASIRKQIAERNNVSESYVARSEKFMRGVEIMEQMVPGMQEKILSGQFKVRDADMHRLAKADYIDRQKIVDEILYPERKVEPKPNTNGAAPEPGKAPYMPMLKIESVYDSDAYPKDVRYEYVALENITTRFRTEFDYQLKIMPDTAQREVILEIIHKHKELLVKYLSSGDVFHCLPHDIPTKDHIRHDQKCQFCWSRQLCEHGQCHTDCIDRSTHGKTYRALLVLIVIDRRFFFFFDRCSGFRLLFRHLNVRLVAVNNRGNGIQQGSSHRGSCLNGQRLVHQIHGRRSHAVQFTDFLLDFCRAVRAVQTFQEIDLRHSRFSLF